VADAIVTYEIIIINVFIIDRFALRPQTQIQQDKISEEF